MENWIAKYIIKSEAILNIGNITIEKCTYKIFSLKEMPFFDSIQNDEHYRLIELTFENNKDSIENAYIRGQDYIDEFIDRFSFISYSFALQVQCISVSKEFVKVNEKFDVIFTHYFKNRRLNSINPEKLSFKIDELQKRYIRLLRSAILALSYEEKLLRYFTVLDQIAIEESEETIKNVCKKCGNENDTGNKKTNKYISEILMKFGFSSTDLNKITAYRGKIAHGGGKRDQDYYLDVNKYAIMLEGPVYNLVIERIKEAKIQNDCNPQIPGYPFLKSTFKFLNNGRQIESLGWDFNSKAAGSFINAEKKNDMFIGVKCNNKNETVIPPEIALPKLRT